MPGSPFSNGPIVPQPRWMDVSAADGNFVALSSTGQIQIPGGYGLGRYGFGPYGEGESSSISFDTTLHTVWTPYTLK